MCGSSLYWRSTKTPDEIEILTGTLDPTVLQGPIGKSLCQPSGGRLWWKNVIAGVTDGEGVGQRFVEGTGGQKIG